MSNNYEHEQDLHPTTQDDSTNLPGKELSEQDLETVSGGVIPAALGAADVIEDAVGNVDGGPDPQAPMDEALSGPVGGAIGGAVETIGAIGGL